MAEKIAYQIEIKNVEQVTKLKEELKALRKQNKLIEQDTKKNSKTGRIAAAQYTKNSKAISGQSKKLRELNKELRGNTGATKKATKSSNGMAKQFIKGAAAIGIIVGAFRAINRIVSSVVSVFTEFEFVMAKVNAVSGATEQEFAGLTKTAEELGRTTFYTAAQVGELMLNFSKLGFTAREIQDAVQPTLDLATATGSDLARAALVAGAAVRGFGLDASETQRVVDVMAVSFSSSAMNIEKWQTSMTKVAPIAKSAGFSIEDTAAIMSKLTDSGIEASIAGTSFRNILLKMQDPTSELSMRFGKTIHSLDELVPAMKKFVAEGGSMADVMEVVDLRQAAAFEQMLTTADGTIALRDALLDANGEGARMAAIVGDTLQGAFLKFTSAMQGLSISVMKGFGEGLQGTVESMASFMNRMAESSKVIITSIKWLTKIVKWFGLYKLGVIGVNVVTAIGIKLKWTYLRALVAVKLGSQKLTIATMTLKRAFQGLISGTGIGLVLVVLSELVPWLLKTNDAIDEEIGLLEKAKLSYEKSLVPIEQIRIVSEDLVKVKKEMNKLTDDEGKLIDKSKSGQRIYNKWKGQAAIKIKTLNIELKKNNQELLTQKTSIPEVTTAIKNLTEALTEQALVKGFNRQIEALVELQANAVVTQKRLADIFDIDEDDLGQWESVQQAINANLSSISRGAPGMANSFIPFEKRMKEINKILGEGGFKEFEEIIDAIANKDERIKIITDAFDELAGPGGIGALLLKLSNLKKEVPDAVGTIKDWAYEMSIAINAVKQARLDSMLTDEEWLEKFKTVKDVAIQTEREYKDELLKVKAGVLAEELATLNATAELRTRNAKRITAIEKQQLDIQLQQRDRAFAKVFDDLKVANNKAAEAIKLKYSIEGQVTAEGHIMLLNLEIDFLNKKAALHGKYGKEIIGNANLIDETQNQLHNAEMVRFREQVGAIGGVGGALQTLAGDNEDLSKVKEAGIAISKVATIVEAGLTLATNLQTIATGFRNVATATEVAVIGAKVTMTGVDTVGTGVNTAGIIANTIATAGAIIKDLIAIPIMATKAILNQGSGDPYSAIFRVIAMIALVAGVMAMFKKGGEVDEGEDLESAGEATAGSFARGGMVRGKSHGQGGERFAVGGRVVELEGGEAVINKRSTAMFKDQLSAMNQAGGGHKFADGGLLNMPSFATASFSALNSGQSSTQKVIVVESDITRTQRKVNVIEAAATI